LKRLGDNVLELLRNNVRFAHAGGRSLDLDIESTSFDELLILIDGFGKSCFTLLKLKDGALSEVSDELLDLWLDDRLPDCLEKGLTILAAINLVLGLELNRNEQRTWIVGRLI
jgi:hypothetical protein